MNKKFMAVLLALALIVGIVPATIDNIGSFAAEKSFKAAPVDVEDQKTVTVKYKTSTGIQKRNVERIKVAKDATEVDVLVKSIEVPEEPEAEIPYQIGILDIVRLAIYHRRNNGE